MDDFERRLATRLKLAAELRPDLGAPSARSHPPRKSVVLTALAAAVVVGAAVAGTALLVNPGRSSDHGPSDGGPPEVTSVPTAPPGDVATWRLAPGQHLTEATTRFTALVARLSCNSGVTGEVRGPSVAVDDETITVSFSVSPNLDGGNCPSNNEVRVEVDLDQPIGTRRLVDGQCLDTEATGTSDCRLSRGVRWPGISDVPGTIKGQVVFVGGPLSNSLAPPSDAIVELTSDGSTEHVAAGRDGTFTARVRPGTYRVTATTDAYSFNGQKGLCEAGEAIPVTAGATAKVQVVCTIK